MTTTLSSAHAPPTATVRGAVRRDTVAPAGDLEAMLGSAHDPRDPVGWAAASRRDAADEPAKAIAEIACVAGLPLSFIPASAGGAMTDLPASIATTRVLSRRDPAVMPMTMLSVTAATSVLIHGSTPQIDSVIEALSQGRLLGFALSEPAHGSELLGNEVTLDISGDAMRLDGCKWLVGSGRDASLVYLVGLSGRRSPAGFSAALVPASALAESWTDEHHSDGLTGVGLDTLQANGIRLSTDTLVGKPGEAFEVALKSMQVVRILSTAASLGSLDTAVRSTLQTLRDPHAHAPTRVLLGTAAASLFLLDTVSTACARLLHTAPAHATLPSAVAKAVATWTADLGLRACGDLQGSRSVLRGESLLPKIRRDLETVRYIDTSPVALTDLLANQLAAVLRERTDGSDEAATTVAFDLEHVLPEYDPRLLQIASRRDECLTNLAATLRGVHAELVGSEREWASDVLGLCTRLDHDLDALRQNSSRPVGTLDRPRVAARAARLYAAAACVHVWFHNRNAQLFGEPPGSLRWLLSCLALALNGADADPRHLVPAAELALELTAANRSYSLTPVALAGDHPDSDSLQQKADA